MNQLAKQHGWSAIPTRDPYLTSFTKVIGKKPARLNVWKSDKSTTYTVGTYLEHPKQGKTQLFRRWVNEKELEKIFKNPREHTNKGYR